MSGGHEELDIITSLSFLPGHRDFQYHSCKFNRKLQKPGKFGPSCLGAPRHGTSLDTSIPLSFTLPSTPFSLTHVPITLGRARHVLRKAVLWDVETGIMGPCIPLPPLPLPRSCPLLGQEASCCLKALGRRRQCFQDRYSSTSHLELT